MSIRRTIAALMFSVVFFTAESLLAQESGWSMAVLPTSAEAQQISQMDILDRPNRPGHFYGNTVRRMHYRGHPLPVPVSCHRGTFRRW